MVIDFDIACTSNANLAHLTSNESCVARNTTPSGKNTVRSDHASEIFWAGLDTSENNVLSLGSEFFSFVSRENHHAGSSTRTSWQANGHHAAFGLGLFVSLGIEDWLKQLVESFWVTRLDRVLRVINFSLTMS